MLLNKENKPNQIKATDCNETMTTENILSTPAIKKDLNYSTGMALALNNSQRLICHETKKPNQIKPFSLIH